MWLTDGCSGTSHFFGSHIECLTGVNLVHRCCLPATGNENSEDLRPLCSVPWPLVN